MFLARVEGSVVATKKDASMSGRKLLLVRPQLVDEKDPTKFRPGANTIVAVDSVGAGMGEMVLVLPGQLGAAGAEPEGRAGGRGHHRDRRYGGCARQTNLQRQDVSPSRNAAECSMSTAINETSDPRCGRRSAGPVGQTDRPDASADGRRGADAGAAATRNVRRHVPAAAFRRVPGCEPGVRGGAGRLSATAAEGRGRRGERWSRSSRRMAEANAEEWGRIELEETKIGRLDHKIEKLKIIKLVPGVEWLHPYGLSGDHGITLEEYTPFGVVGAITPSTHSIPTLSGNIINMVAAGNAVVFNAHPVGGQMRGDGGARLQRGDLARDGHRKHHLHHRAADAGVTSKRICAHEAVRLLLRHRRAGRGQGGDADGQARDLRRAGQSAGVGGRHRLHEAGRQVRSFKARPTTTTCSASAKRKCSCWTRSPTNSWPSWKSTARSG